MPQNIFPEVVNNLRLFSGIPESEKGELLKGGQIRHIQKGEYLFHHGDPIKHFYIVCSGTMQVVRETPDGKAVTTDVRSKGDTMCKVDIMSNAVSCHRAGAVAIGDAIVLEFPAVWLKKVAANPIVALNILSAISQYVHMVEVEVEHKSTLSAAQRVGCFLQRLCIMYDLDPKGFELPYGKSLIASRLGLEPETFSRTLLKLKEHGINVENTHVSFCDVHAMEEFVCSHCSIVGECTTHQEIQEKFSTKKQKFSQ